MSSRGTWLAGIAATVGLIFSAATTAYTGLAFQAQSAQQREQADTEEAKQASQVNSYIATSADLDRERAVIENTSGLPAYKVTFAVETSDVTVLTLIVGTVGPCAKVMINLPKIVNFNDSAGMIVQFWDSAGHAWRRDTGSDEIDGTKFNPPRLERLSGSAGYAPDGIGELLPGDSLRWGTDQTEPIALYVQTNEMETAGAATCG
ncbi:hypothetical protein [Streptomyces mirabilis]|uniref:hypothetical protein n=1 Tax=Streptomyces mirabilis TaxID=68239 RepID=UPI00369696B5